MRKLFFVALVALCITGCNNKADESATASTSTTTASSEQLAYPYTLEEPYKDWQPGDKRHAVMVMKSLKAFETGNFDETIADFADTVEMKFDYFEQKVPKDSLKAFFASERAKYNNVVIKMSDWESVISSDKKTEYVTLWYKQIWTDKNGKSDSMSVVDDVRIVNGKITELDEKTRHYAVKK
jgi:uncharacterized protein YcfL